MARLNVIFDADDTLWATEALYEDARTACVEYLTSVIEPAAWLASQSSIDSELYESLGLSPQRFPISCVIAARRLAHGLSEADERAIRWLAETVFRRRAELIEGAQEALAQLSRTCDLTLLTQGDALVQNRRIDESGLAAHFDRIAVTPKKTRSEFAALQGLRPHTGWVSVGNSLGSDILPAVESGMSGIWLRDVPMWDRERVDCSVPVVMKGCLVADDLGGVVEVIKSLA